MKRPILKQSIFVGVAGLCLIGTVILFETHRRCAYTSPSKSYATLALAMQQGVITNGWLPEFLPTTAREIRAKYHYEANRVLAVFSFDPSDDVKEMLTQAQELPKEQLRNVRPSVICRREPWFPNSIMNGEFDSFVGFKLYRIPDTFAERNGALQNRHLYWYLLMDGASGVCYLWSN